ncbi:MAG TPA: hypothetical protein VL635_20775 [Trinickia sp.]|jgi:hypothetical protein|nr:hypothetical protein [Trinickia sp.]
MMTPSIEWAQSGASRVGAPSAHAVVADDGGAFGAVMTQIDRRQALAAAGAPVLTPAPRGAALDALARQLDDIGRQRLEAQRSSDALAGAWASGTDAQTLAVTMHRQARAMAAYNISVMAASKLVGVTTGALKQLTASG